MLLAQLLQERAKRGTTFPMSEGQKGLWLLQQMEPGNPAYNISLPVRFRSHLNVAALRETLARLIQRHAGLRTTFAERDGELVQSVHDSMPVVLEQVDAGTWSEEELQGQLERAVMAPFDLAQGPLLRTHLFARAPDDHIVLTVAHHIVIDFWSLVILLMEIRQIYPAACAGSESTLPPVTSNYADFVQWQSRLLASDRGEQLAGYWKGQLAGVPHVLELPVDRQRPRRFSSRGGVVSCHLSEILTRDVNELAAREKVTIYTLLLAAFQVLLGRFSGQRDFVIGTPFVGRSQKEFEDTVGYFVNLLPIRASVHGELTFRQLLQEVSATVMGALEHQDYPFSRIVELLQVTRDPSRPPLVQATFTLERSQRQEEAGRGRFLFPNAKAHVDVGGLVGEAHYVKQRACRHELELVLEQASGTINGLLCYCADLFDKSMMERMVERYQMLLRRAVANPDTPLSQLSWFADGECARVVHEWNQTAVEFSGNLCLHRLFQQQAARTPDAIAMVSGGRQYSYRQLDAWTDRLARKIVARGAKPGQHVAVCLDRSSEEIAVILAILKAGAAFVPLDPNCPADRLRTVLAELDAVLVVGQQENLERLEEMAGDTPAMTSRMLLNAGEQDHDPGPPETDVQPRDLAYVIYTSGSTGRPKGVMVEHQAICNTIQWRSHALPVGTDDRVLMLLPCFFDASLAIIFSTLTQGGCLVLAPPGAELNPATLLDLAIRERVSVLPSVPRLLQVLVDHPLIGQLEKLRQVQVGGEALPLDLCQRIVTELNVSLANMYGPTEAAVETCCWTCQPGDQPVSVSIGRPIANAQTYVLDADQQPVPVGVPGELYIGGAGLARGYLNDRRQTAERFLSNPLPGTPGERVYRTGDCCRWLADGTLEFLGRLDQQVKLRGYRIELAEIEHVLAAHAAVREAAVAVHASRSREPRLVGYIVPADKDSLVDEDGLRRDLLRTLPPYMVPAVFETLESLPRTASGKLDRQSLPNPRQRTRSRRPFVAPSTPLEHFLVDACQKTLNVERVGLRDSFYELGGTSIQGATLLAMLQEELGDRIQTTALFDLTEIGDLSNYVARHHAETVAVRFGAESALLSARDERGGRSADNPAQPGVVREQVTDLIVPIQPEGCQTPLFMVHPPGGIVVCYQPLAHCLGGDQPLYGIRARGLHGEADLPTDLREMAAEYVEAMRAVCPTGPYCLGGWSLGGVVAYEMAQQLRRQGEAIRVLLLLDTTIPQGAANQQYLTGETSTGLEYGLDVTLEQLGELGPDQQLPYLWDHARKLGVIDEAAPESLVKQVLSDLKRLFHSHLQLASQYAIKPYPGRIILMRPLDAPVEVATTPDRGWRQLARDVDVHFVPGQHHSMVKEPHVKVLARKLQACLGREQPLGQ